MVFSWLYQKTQSWSQHLYAPYILAGVSFCEASCLPVPPDVLLIPMGIASPKKVWRLALITTLSSVLGGLLGYAIGMFFIHWLLPYIKAYGYFDHYQMVQQWFMHYGFLALFVAGFTPIPYKIFTVSAGAAHLAILPFVIASFLGRGLRFYLVAACIYFGGERLQLTLAKHIDHIGWLMVFVGLILYGIYR